jgi:hypothetical protein
MPVAAVVTLIITAVLVAALAFYLIWIALTLRQVEDTLGKVTFGVRAIAHRTGPVNATVADINGNLEAVAGALEGLLGQLGAQDPGVKVP